MKEYFYEKYLSVYEFDVKYSSFIWNKQDEVKISR